MSAHLGLYFLIWDFKQFCAKHMGYGQSLRGPKGGGEEYILFCFYVGLQFHFLQTEEFGLYKWFLLLRVGGRASF